MTGYFAPAFEVVVAGSPLPEAIEKRITEIAVTTETDTKDSFRIVLANPLPELPFTHGQLAGTFEPGASVEIRMGYSDARLERLFAGEITSIGCAFPESGLATVIVSGQTRLHHLQGSTHTRTFVRMSDREIAQKILDELPSSPLTLDADPTPPGPDYVIQYNQTDLAFLLERANLIGFSVSVDDKTLHYKQAAPSPAPVSTLVWGNPGLALARAEHLPLRSFMPTLNTLRPLTKVTVQGYDQKQARRFQASAPSGAAPSRTSAAEVAGPAGRRVETVVVDQPLESQAQAQQLAEAVYDRATLDLISGTGATVGVPTLRAGGFVTLGGLGDVFDGDYTVTQATHTISGAGYLTSFNAHKGTVG